MGTPEENNMGNMDAKQAEQFFNMVRDDNTGRVY